MYYSGSNLHKNCNSFYFSFLLLDSPVLNPEIYILYAQNYFIVTIPKALGYHHIN